MKLKVTKRQEIEQARLAEESRKEQALAKRNEKLQARDARKLIDRTKALTTRQLTELVLELADRVDELEGLDN